MLPRFFQSGVAVANHAELGESIRSSMAAGRFEKIFSLIRPGDYLLIQYGHNDMPQSQERSNRTRGKFISSSWPLIFGKTPPRNAMENLTGPVRRCKLRKCYFAVIGLVSLACCFGFHAARCGAEPRHGPSMQWPAVTQSARPWTRWWWHGSAVDEANLTRLLETYQRAGLGGVEITCIYGVQGNKDRNREYLSEAWVEAVQHTLREAKRLGMGVDLPAGSGWRMGGPLVRIEEANSKLVLEKTKLSSGEVFSKRFSKSTPQAVVAVDSEGIQVDLTKQLRDNGVEWNAPAGAWTVYTLAYRWAGDRVKRPGPGGEGLNINPFSKTSVSSFLAHFGQTLERLPGVRAQFHDSFEYAGDWQPEFLDEFAARRGYRLESQLPALWGDGPRDTVERVKCDYRETLSDLVLEHLVRPWVEWSHQHGQLARNQSHGSPANWLDLYAACDIPETESFGRLQGVDADQLVLKFAASAANVAGKQLVSAESATWLDEHFNVTLAQVKQIVDRQMLAGVNHVFFHGTAYSPEDAAWPGWLFYASTQLNPQNPIWRDLPALTAYITRCQSVLQSANPTTTSCCTGRSTTRGMLLRGCAWRFASIMATTGSMVGHWATRQRCCKKTPMDSTTSPILDSLPAIPATRAPSSAGGKYQVVVVPQAKHLPLATLRKLAELAEQGAKVVFWRDLPASEPGMAGATPSPAWNAAIERLRRCEQGDSIVVGANLLDALQQTGVRVEKGLSASGLSFLRKQIGGESIYFLKNDSAANFTGWVPLASKFPAAVIMNPLTGQIGCAQTHLSAEGLPRGALTARSGRVAPGGAAAPRSQVVRPGTTRPLPVRPSPWPGPGKSIFSPVVPPFPRASNPDSHVPWTEAPDKSAQNFAGTARYSVTFDAGPIASQSCLLDLGQVLGMLASG